MIGCELSLGCLFVMCGWEFVTGVCGSECRVRVCVGEYALFFVGWVEQCGTLYVVPLCAVEWKACDV